MVSVVLATKDRHLLLLNAIESVWAQNHCNVEVIGVDDGSKEPARHEGGDPRVRVLRNETSLGRPAARRVGFRSSCGDFLAILDDGLFLPGEVAVWTRDGRSDQRSTRQDKRKFVNSSSVCERFLPVLAENPRAAVRYYGRLGWQALRCGDLRMVAAGGLRMAAARFDSFASA